MLSINQTDLNNSPIPAKFDSSYNDTDSCADSVVISSSLLYPGRGGGEFQKITEKYNGFTTYFYETVPATTDRIAQGYFLYYRRYEGFSGYFNTIKF